MTLQEQFNLKVAESRKAYQEGRMADGDKAKTEAETLSAAIKSVGALDAMEASTKSEPMRPPLPGAGAGAGLNGNMGNGQQQPEGGASVKAAYIRKFGDPDAAVKALLTDLHGANYEDAYWTQKAAFRRYLRGGESALNADHVRALKHVVYTPQAILAAFDQGIDDVKVFKSTMVEAVDTLGGYIVPVDFQASVIERLRGMTVMRGRSNAINTSRDSVEIPKATGGDDQYTSAVRVTWVDETPTAGTAETNLTFGMEKIPVNTAMAETPLSRNLVEDAAFNIENYLSQKFAEAAAIDEDNQFLTGDGVGKPQGILPGGVNSLSLTEVVSGGATTLTFGASDKGLIPLTYGIAAQYRQNAVWIGERNTYRAISQLTDGQGQYLWREMFGNNASTGGAGTTRTLLGYPMLEQEGMPSIAASAYPLIFGDPRGYTIVDRVGMSVERYLDSPTARANLIYYVMRRRLGGQVTETWRFAVQKVSAS